jgi:hypothetical protein
MLYSDSNQYSNERIKSVEGKLDVQLFIFHLTGEFITDAYSDHCIGH